MAILNQVYRCPICGNVVEVVGEGGGTLVCCGKPMELVNAKSSDEGKEKHLPVVSMVDGKIEVNVGSIPHPMSQEHYIMWIECIEDGHVDRRNLTYTDLPKASFESVRKGNITIRAYCNVHGLWMVDFTF